MSSDEAPDVLVKKKYKVEVEFTVRMSEVKVNPEFPDQTPEFIARQRRLQQALRASENALTLKFVACLLSKFEGGIVSGEQIPTTEKVFELIANDLPTEDLHAFREAEIAGHLWDEAEPVFYDSISVSYRAFQIFEVDEQENGVTSFRPIYKLAIEPA